MFRRSRPHPINRGLDLGLHSMDGFAIGIDQGLFGLDFGDDGASGREVGEVMR